MSPRVKRKRGGQPGNQNARTHGFYARFLDPETSKDIHEVTMLNGVDEEIALLRHKILSVVANDPKNLEVVLRAFNAMATLIRTRQGLKQYDNRKMSKSVEYIAGSLARDESGTTLTDLR